MSTYELLGREIYIKSSACTLMRCRVREIVKKSSIKCVCLLMSCWIREICL